MSNLSNYEVPRSSSNTIGIEVSISAGAAMRRVAEFEYREMQRVVNYQTNVQLPNEDDIFNYIKTLIYLRVSDVRREIGESKTMVVITPASTKVEGEIKTEIPETSETNEFQIEDERLFRQSKKGLRVPARLYTILANIGKCHSFENNFKFEPILNMNTTGLLTVKEMDKISILMESLWADGYATVKGLPREPEGSIEFMALTLINDEVRGMSVVSPVYGFLAYLVEAEATRVEESVKQALYRKLYSSKDVYYSNFHDYFRSVETNNNNNVTSTGQGNNTKHVPPNVPNDELNVIE